MYDLLECFALKRHTNGVYWLASASQYNIICASSKVMAHGINESGGVQNSGF